MTDGPESELEVALDRVRSLPPIVDPRDAVVRAAVRFVKASDDCDFHVSHHNRRIRSHEADDDEMARLKNRVTFARKARTHFLYALRAAVAAYRAATTPTARPGAEE